MAKVTPFCAIRPSLEKAGIVPSHPVESYAHGRIKEILDSNPYSFLQIIYAGREKDIDHERQLHEIKTEFDRFIDKGILVMDSSPCYYVYRQIKNGISHLGVIALASLDDYETGVIRIHELTLAEREQKLKEYLSITEINAEPICISYPYHEKIDALLRKKSNSTPLYDYEADGMRHTVWQLMDSNELNTLRELFTEIPFLYIADGHHRAASSYLLRQEKMLKRDSPEYERYNHFMAVFFADRELTIYNYNRLVSDLNGNNCDSIIKALSGNFEIKTLGSKPVAPKSSREMTMYIEKEWYSLTIDKSKLAAKDPLKLLDVSILNDYILNPVFGIADLRKDKRIAFLPGTKGTEDLMKAVDNGKFKVGFCLYPISFGELKSIADSAKEMPPKSTWIEPKLESGLLVYSFDK
jgi:uncharacterized protein (DUF1015 family)